MNIVDKIIALNKFGKVLIKEPTEDLALTGWYVSLSEKESNVLIAEGHGNTLQNALDVCISEYNVFAEDRYLIKDPLNQKGFFFIDGRGDDVFVLDFNKANGSVLNPVEPLTKFIEANFGKKIYFRAHGDSKLVMEIQEGLSGSQVEKIVDHFNFIEGLHHECGDMLVFDIGK